MIHNFGIQNNIPQAAKNFYDELLLNTADLLDGALYYGYPLFEQDNKKITLKGVLICNKGLFIFYDSIEELSAYTRYITQIIMGSEELSKLYFEKKLEIQAVSLSDNCFDFLNKIEALNNCLSTELIRKFNEIIQKCFGLNKEDDREIKNKNSLGAAIQARNKYINNYDEIQFKTLYENNFNNYRIRGLAGSGKTILLVKKMAYLHYTMPELKMAYVFYTKSLKQYITEMFIRFYKDFEPYKSPNWKNIVIVHCWGTKSIDGFYTLLCKEVNVPPQRYSKGVSIDDVCQDLLEIEQKSKLKIYDFVFIDEAQDFKTNFFKLAKSSLKPTGKLIYAYDELQTLDFSQKRMPDKSEIFDQQETCQDVGLSICYRTPLEILVTAHAIGLGIYRKNSSGIREFSTFIQDKSLWEAIGYRIEKGKLDYGQEVILYRDKIFDCPIKDPIEIKETKNLDDEFANVISYIIDLYKNQDILPNDILIIDLDSINLADNFQAFRNQLYNYLEINKLNQGSKRLFETNLVNKDNALDFKIQNSISYTTIYRAKGNEANIVFILNAHKMGVLERFRRNRLFTAMTRARMKVVIYGDSEMRDIINEWQEVQANGFKLKFVYPTQKQIEIYRGKMLEESKNVQGVKNAIEIAKQLKSDDPTKLMNLILEQTGQTNLPDLIRYLQQIDNKDEE